MAGEGLNPGLSFLQGPPSCSFLPLCQLDSLLCPRTHADSGLYSVVWCLCAEVSRRARQEFMECQSKVRAEHEAALETGIEVGLALKEGLGTGLDG